MQDNCDANAVLRSRLKRSADASWLLWYRRALLRWPDFSTQIKCAINHAHVTVGLWKIPQHAPIERIEFLGQQANVIAVQEQSIEQPLRLLITTLQYVVVDEPKTADQKCSFACRQAVNGIFSFVA